MIETITEKLMQYPNEVAKLDEEIGTISFKQWKEIVSWHKKQLGGGKLICRHEYGDSKDLPPKFIRAKVVFPNGVTKTMHYGYSSLYRCGKCGKVKGENWDPL